jgi:glyoxylase-like metal-dependent hydrolase (beta-lactamase superfamily II)
MFSHYHLHGYSPSLYECLAQAKVERMDGDFDVFGDGSVKVISTPGHTPGHCSLQVRLPKAGPILLSGDVAHYRFNLEHRCVPTMNFDIGQSLSSMDRIDAIVRDEKVQLWLNHDTVQSATILTPRPILTEIKPGMRAAAVSAGHGLRAFPYLQQKNCRKSATGRARELLCPG